MNSDERLYNTIMNKARDAGAESPQLGESSNGDAVIVDIESGRVYEVEVKEIE